MSEIPASGVSTRLRRKRLMLLREIVERFKHAKTNSYVTLDGQSRRWNMMHWECGTKACALGNYALTPYGRRHLVLLHQAFVGTGWEIGVIPTSGKDADRRRKDMETREIVRKEVYENKIKPRLQNMGESKSSSSEPASLTLERLGADTITEAAAHFGINNRDAAYLFLPESYTSRNIRISPDMVIRHIDKMLHKYGHKVPPTR